MKQKSYTIYLGKDGPSGMTIAGLSIIACWSLGVLCLLSLYDREVKPLVIAALVFLAIATGVLLFLEIRKKDGPDQYIFVMGDSFRVGGSNRDGKLYLFTDITEVSLFTPMKMGRRSLQAGNPCWKIFVGKTCVAMLNIETKNVWRFLLKVESLGLLPYGTKIRP